jgi:hypothetical protein
MKSKPLMMRHGQRFRTYSNPSTVRVTEYTTIRIVSKTNGGPAVKGMENMEISIEDLL